MERMNCPINLVVDLIPTGAKNRPGYVNTCKYITVHDTGNSSNGADAKSHAKYIKTAEAASAQISWHFTVDDNGAYQHLPLSETGYHAGDGKGAGNRESIGIEICMNADGSREKAEENAAKLIAYLMAEYSIPLKNVKQHFDWSGKNCPQIIRARLNGWSEFKNKIIDFGGDNMTLEEAKIILKGKVGLADDTIKYLEFYKFGNDLILKLAKAVK